jgi:hypothetical protein
MRRLNAKIRLALRRQIEVHGVAATAHAIGVAENTLVRLVGDLPVTRGSIALATQYVGITYGAAR